MQTALQGDLRAVCQERDGDTRFDPRLVVVEQRPDRQVALRRRPTESRTAAKRGIAYRISGLGVWSGRLNYF